MTTTLVFVIVFTFVGGLILANFLYPATKKNRSPRQNDAREVEESYRKLREYLNPPKPAPVILTDQGIFIPDLTEQERELLRTTPTEWAERAARDVAKQAQRAYEAAHPRFENYRDSQWLRVRARLVDEGHEQWLLWMERDTENEEYAPSTRRLSQYSEGGYIPVDPHPLEARLAERRMPPK